MSILIVSEKPSAAQKIASALGHHLKKGKKTPYYEVGKDILVAPAAGHLFSLKQKTPGSGYPVFDIEWVPASEVKESSGYTKDYVQVLRGLAKNADEVVNACDFDIEGALIGWNIIRFLAHGKKSSRMKFSTLTPDELRDAFEHRSHLDLNNAHAGEARHFLDWLWGINTSRALMSAIKSAGAFRVMSIGRVQGPALAVLAKREKEIAAFVAEPYWQLFAYYNSCEFTHVPDKFWKEVEADKALANSSKTGMVKSVVERKVKVLPPPPFDLTSLQMEAYKCFGFTPTITLELAQHLYEAAVISYPRTSSQKLPERLNLKKIIAALAKNPNYQENAQELLNENRVKPREGEKDDPAHPAIHPTGHVPAKLSPTQAKLYDLIVKRFLSCFAPEAKRIRLDVILQLGNEDYGANGATTIEKGWMEYYEPYTSLEDVELPLLKQGDAITVDEIKKVQKETQPPKRFSQASLVKKLETENLGTKATRASIIQTLYDRNYITDKRIQVTPLGMSVYKELEAHVPEIMSEQLTRHIEEEMEGIEKGTQTKDKVVGEGKEMLIKILGQFKEREEKIGKGLYAALKTTQREASVLGKCPACKEKDLVIRKSKYGLFVGCSGYPNCRQLYPLPKMALIKPLGKICEKCNTPMITVIRKAKRPFNMCLDTKCETKKNWGHHDANAMQATPAAAKPTSSNVVTASYAGGGPATVANAKKQTLKAAKPRRAKKAK